MTFIDLSHSIHSGLITYKGLPAPLICDFHRREDDEAYGDGVSFHIGKIEMVANTGTYIDAPFHRYEDGQDIAALPLESLAELPLRVVDVGRSIRAIDTSFFEGLSLAGKAVLVRTDWSRHWGSERYFEGHPFLTAGAARCLVSAKARLVGIDSLNIDDTADPVRPVHSILLGAGIPIVEHLCNLDRIRDHEGFFSATPAPVKGLGSFPVRAYARVTS